MLARIIASAFTVVLVCALESGNTQAATLNLQTDLIDLRPAGITSGGSEYFDFRDDPGFPDLSTWEVSDLPGNSITFNYNAALGANPLDNTGGLADLQLTLKFEVRSLTAPWTAGGDNVLELTDFTGNVSINEIVFDDTSLPHDPIGSKFVDQDNVLDMTTFVDNPATDPFTVHVHKIITVEAGSSIEGFRQEFNAVPEPSTYALFGLGLLAIGYHYKRRK